MIVRAVRRALVVSLLAVAGLAIATPAQAAEAQIDITHAWDPSPDQLELEGAVTCSAPTGEATITVTAVQVMPFVFGSGSTSVPCAAGPVSWSLSVYGYPEWHHGPRTINAFMGDTNGGVASVSIQG